RELTAEAGLCVVIPCSFTTADEFTPKHTVWYKCETSQHSCSEPDIIFHSNKNTDKKAQAGFEGRVSRLEPDVSQNNCSIIINDLKESDSGSYQLRVTGELNGKEDGFTFIPRVTVSVKGMKSYSKANHVEKLMIPTLTEGQQATLTCTAPGLCSGSVPEITWTWRGSFTQRHISTLTFNPSAEHHNTSVTCKVNFTGRKSTEETLTVNVNCEYFATSYLFGVTTVREGDVLNLTCSVESFPPSLIRVLFYDSDYMFTGHTKIQNGSGCVLQSEGLTCVCIREGFPLPNIKWPLLTHHTEYSVITSVSNHTVNSTVSVTVKNHGNSTVECVSNNGNGEVRENLLINNNLSKKDGKFCLVVVVVLN
uniref:Ig-like domain-containing protein n=1 Tax=Haplochromis burtoni TaxID=8153 RepID=A0A3Q2VM68_HAPBU